MTPTSMLHRLAAAIENGSITGSFFRLTPEQAHDKAKEILDATGWKSLAAAKRHMANHRIPYNL